MTIEALMAAEHEADKVHIAACIAQDAAQRRFDRSRSHKNRVALVQAESRCWAAAEAYRAAREAVEDALNAMERKARRDANAAKRAAQLTLSI